jgi:hypothetical protein
MANDPALFFFIACAALFVLYVVGIELPDLRRRRRLRRLAGGKRRLKLPPKRPQLRVVAGGVKGWR